MSTPFYDLASLVLVPSGYKASKVYAQKPLTTDGQLSCTRSTGASRVASNGLIEKVRTNLILQSNTFSTTWTASNASVTSGQAGYDGTNNAWLLSKSAANGYISQGPASSGSETISVYAKAGTDNWLHILVRDSASVFFGGYWDLQNGVVGSAVGATTLRIESVGNGWYRCSASFVKSTSNYYRIYPAEGNNDTSGTSGNILIQAAQLETGDIATQPILTTTAAVSVGPVANVPRLDYAPTLGQSGVSCPRLILEGQRTNTLLLSEQLDVLATWSRGGVSVTANNAVSPDGYTNADLITADGTTTQHYLLQGQSGAARTYSIFLKMGTQRYVQILTSGSAAPVANYDLQNGVANMVGSSSTASIVNYGNGWYRCILSTTDAAAASFYLLFASSMTSGRFEANNSSGTIWAYGAQAEVGAYATSYIPTLGAAVTRGADACSKTGISSLIGQTQGTIFVDAQRGSATEFTTLSISDGSINNRVTIVIDAQSTVRSIVVTSGTVQTTLSASLTGTRVKAAITYTASGFKLFYNGALVNSSTKAVFGATLSRYGFDQANGGNALFRSVNQTLLFPTALTDAQAIELTTL